MTYSSDRITMDLRRARMQQLVGGVMEEVRDAIPAEFHRDLYNALSHILYENGAYIMTDADRAEMGLEARDSLGWTSSERVKAEYASKQALLIAMQAMVPIKSNP